MKFKMPSGMFEATRLTREGRLTEATSLIQRLLGGKKDAPAAKVKPSPRGNAADVIDRNADEAQTIETVAPGKPRKADAGEQEREPRGGQYLTAKYANDAGHRDYKLYIPGSYSGQPMPLVVMMHGCTQSADDFAKGTGMNALAEAQGFLVAYPEQSQSANPNKCWNWFNPRDQQRDSGEPSLIAGITREIMSKYAVDARRVYIAGLSAGGAAAAIMGVAYPDLYAAIGVHSGLPAGSAVDLASALAAMRNPKDPSGLAHGTTLHGRARLVPTIVFHGDKDTTVHPRNGHHVIEQGRAKELGSLRAVSQKGHVVGGHMFTRTDHRDAAGRTVLELWVIHGGGHAWSGGQRSGSYTDPHGPDASREMVRFFLEHPART